MDYNTSEIRRVARQISSVASSVRSLSDDDIKRMRQSVDGQLSGKAADGLSGELSEMSGDINSLATSLSSIASELKRYAARLDAADAAAKRTIGQR